ncbi:hypothetical protein GB937_009657 [Aspergillus fischeri]|nr:hypothetical protein GB937_009657 [Aspergillus fischeri]
MLQAPRLHSHKLLIDRSPAAEEVANTSQFPNTLELFKLSSKRASDNARNEWSQTVISPIIS